MNVNERKQGIYMHVPWIPYVAVRQATSFLFSHFISTNQPGAVVQILLKSTDNGDDKNTVSPIRIYD